MGAEIPKSGKGETSQLIDSSLVDCAIALVGILQALSNLSYTSVKFE